MKKSIILIAVIITLSLTAFSFINRNNTAQDQLEASVNEEKVISPEAQAKEKINKRIFNDFIYDVGPRFGAIKREDVNKATTIDAFFDEEHIQSIESLKSVSVIIIIDDKQSDIREIGYSKELTDAQLELLQTSDDATNFLVKAEYQQINKETGDLEDNYSTPHYTIVPETQAKFLDGMDALKDFLKIYSEDARKNVDPEKLQPAKLFFTVTKKGTIENIHLDRSSNYPEVDEVMKKLISEVPGTWIPAENAKGEKVDQELVVSFGLMGC